MDWLAAELWDRAAVQVVLVLIGSVAVIAARTSKKRWLATAGVVLPTLALVLTSFDLARSYARILQIEGFTPSITPPVPLDQLSTAKVPWISYAPLVVGQAVAVILPIATWVWARMHWPESEHRGLRRLALGGAGVMTISLLGASHWAGEFVYYQGFPNYGCAPHGWFAAEQSFVMLERLRKLIMIAGATLGVAGIVYGLARARHGVTPSPRVWTALLTLLGLATAAKLWTADERADTRAYFPHLPRGHNGFHHLHAPVSDPFHGPALEHCSFDWSGADLIYLDDPDEYLVQSIEWLDHCGEPEGIDAILADPAEPVARVALALRTAEAEGLRRLGVASLRPIPVERATTGAFVRLQTCVVEFSIGERGVPLDHFATWGELANAADAADGNLVIAVD